MHWLFSFLLTGAAVIFLTACVGLMETRSAEKPIPNEIPCVWSLEEIAKQTPPFGVGGRVYVLAWSIVEDDRPMRVESCLALKVFNKGEEYYLSHLYHHPNGKNPEWRESMTHVLGREKDKSPTGHWIFHYKRFKKKPGNKELYAALSFEEVNWSFGLEKGWKFVGCGVCERSWKEAIGEKPNHFFGN